MEWPKIDLSSYDLSWWKRAWLWLRRWGWVPLGFILLVLGFVAGGFIFRRKPDGTIKDPLSDIKDAVRRHDDQVDVELREAQRQKEEQIRQIEQEHAAEIAKLTAEQEAKRDELRRNPKKLARWLTNLARGEE
jgi:hypothetical protein